MTIAAVSDRVRLVQKLFRVQQLVAQAITEEFFQKHPDWLARYGEKGRQACTADACLHIQFLAGAIEDDSPEGFADYSRWTAGMLAARGIPAHSLEEHLAQLETHLAAALPPEERPHLVTFLTRGREACEQILSVSGSAYPSESYSASDLSSGPGFQPASGDQSSRSKLSLTRSVFLAAILAGQRRAALNIVEEALRSGHSHVDIYIEVFTAALHQVGRLWEQNKITVAQEHMATAITQFAIASIYPRMVPDAAHRGTMVVTGVSGELHQVGANLVADAMESQGWTVHFLGSNLPHSSVLATIEASSADVLCISTTIVANLPSVADLIHSVRAKLPTRAPRIILGGAAHALATLCS